MLGRNYTAIHLNSGLALHKLDLSTAWTGVRITVDDKVACVEFPRGRYPADYSYPLNALPRQPFKNVERVEVWDDFIKAATTPVPVENLDEDYHYDC